MKLFDRILLILIFLLAAFIVFRPYAMPPSSPMMPTTTSQNPNQESSVVPLGNNKIMITDTNPQSTTYGKFVIITVGNNEQISATKGNWKSFLMEK